MTYSTDGAVNDNKTEEYNYFTLTYPKNLFGIDFLWKIVFDAENTFVAEKATEFLIELYLVIIIK